MKEADVSVAIARKQQSTRRSYERRAYALREEIARMQALRSGFGLQRRFLPSVNIQR